MIFAFFMISDPRTTPSSRAGRITFALAVALAASYIEFVLFRANGALYALIICAPLVPLLDRFLPGSTYAWPQKPSAVPLFNQSGVHHHA
ncbi:MAG: Na+-translocating ferredoxin:NAD+ oxidoreductase RnfD subunit [Gammaproteobacteria bacterium]|jgi:Na+-translocating ferredoxin:NAD+ oxidoreductase RnfD subunit